MNDRQFTEEEVEILDRLTEEGFLLSVGEDFQEDMTDHFAGIALDSLLKKSSLIEDMVEAAADQDQEKYQSILEVASHLSYNIADEMKAERKRRLTSKEETE